jgi:crotonobetainyl-CoA:carnitine CoA-transferase CaiB-like acyl-CoA transferase
MQATADRTLPAPYAGLKVVEIAEDTGGEFLGRMLGEMGADVVKAEPPTGSPTRGFGPFAKDKAGPDRSLHFWLYNSNKRGVTIDLGNEGIEALAPLLDDADVLISTFQPARLAELALDLDALSARFPKLIIVSLTPYGFTGPWKDYKASNLTGLAGGGPLNMCGYDDHSIPPINPGGDQAYHGATAFGHIGVLLALLDRQRTGLGQVVDVSMHNAATMNVELANPFWFYPRVNVQRQTCRHAQPSPTQSALFQCADGRYVYYTLILSDSRAWDLLVEWMDRKGMAAMLTEPEFKDIAYRQQRFDEIQSLVECFFLCHDSGEMYLEGQANGLPVGLMNAPEDLFEDEHLQQRDFFVEVDMGDDVGPVAYPGDSYRFSSFGSVPRTRAPKLGEHNDDLLGSRAAAAE